MTDQEERHRQLSEAIPHIEFVYQLLMDAPNWIQRISTPEEIRAGQIQTKWMLEDAIREKRAIARTLR